MSKISYCSLEEAWGSSYNKNADTEHNSMTNTVTNSAPDNKYDILTKTSEIERENVISNMNNIERNSSKYKFTPPNKVESNEFKQLYEKMEYIENEFKKYKTIENFDNKIVNPSPNKSNDLIDLILLIIIGLIVIFVMNSIFSIGKAIGMKHR